MSNELIAGFRMSGEFIKNLEDKKFRVVSAENREVDDLDREGVKKQKTVLTIEIAGHQLEYYPNKTSLNFIAKSQGNEMTLKSLVGYKGEFITINQKIGQVMRDVIYAKGSVEE
ncbi:MAG: hypothetical protein QGI80_02905 [archaeon]|jgi:hypothetical protein|nr:hypothetical protein [archaeon]